MANEVISVQDELLRQLEQCTLTPEILATPQFAAQYCQLSDFLKRATEIKANVDAAIKNTVRDRFMETGEATIAVDGYRYTYVPESTSERLDTRALKEADPEMYRKYVKVVHVNDSIRVYRPKSDDGSAR